MEWDNFIDFQNKLVHLVFNTKFLLREQNTT